MWRWVCIWCWAARRWHGLFNAGRIPFAAIYYLFPVWVPHGPDGTLVLDAYRSRLIDAAELPPDSFLLSDALPMRVAILGAALLGVATAHATEALYRLSPDGPGQLLLEGGVVKAYQRLYQNRLAADAPP